MQKAFEGALRKFRDRSFFLAALRRTYPFLLLRGALLEHNEVIIAYSDAKRAKILDLVSQIRNETELLMGPNEACQVFMTTERTKKVKGAIAEVGVYNGGSAKLICEAKCNRSLFLFDTFEGLPETDNVLDTKFHAGMFVSNLALVKELLKGYPKVFFFKGIFPDTAKPILNKTFSFVNIDVDTYSSTKACLEFFYPRINKGGAILSHDYSSALGVRRAIDEFFINKPEVVYVLSGTQCLIVKL